MNTLAPRVRYNPHVILSMRLDHAVLVAGELDMEVVVNRVEDVCYPDRTTFSYSDWLPVPPHPWLSEEAEVDA